MFNERVKNKQKTRKCYINAALSINSIMYLTLNQPCWYSSLKTFDLKYQTWFFEYNYKMCPKKFQETCIQQINLLWCCRLLMKIIFSMMELW